MAIMLAGWASVKVNAASYTWNVDANANWNAGGSWNPSTDYPRLVDDIANVTNNITGDRAITMGAAVSVGTLNIGDASGNNKFTLNAGSALTFDVSAGNAVLTRTATGTGADTISTPVTLNDPITITINSVNGSLTIGGGIYGTNALTKAGAGTLTLSTANTFSGTTAITAGTLSLGNSTALQNSVLDTSASIAGDAANGLKTTVATLTLGGLSGNKNFAAAGGVFTTTSGGYGSVTALTLNPGADISATYSGVITNGAAGMTLTKNGAGTQILQGANTYSGATTIYAGTLALGGAGMALSSAFSVYGGTLTLDNSSGWANRLADATALTLGSLTLTSSNGASAQIETVGATTLAIGGKITVNNGATAGDQTTLALGAVTRSTGVAVDFVGTGLGSLGGGGSSPYVTSTGAWPGVTNGILPWATVGGTNWATTNANGIVAYSGTFVDPTSAASDGTKNAQWGGSGTMNATKSFNSLNVISSGSGQSFDLSTAGVLTLTSGGILKSGTNAYTISGSAANAITAGTELIAHVDGGDLTISAPLNTAITNLAKGGTGKLILSGTRATTLGPISIAGAVELQGNNTTVSGVISGPGALTLNLTSGQTLTVSGANTFSGQLTIGNGTFFTTTSPNNRYANGVFGNSALPIILGASGQTGRLATRVDGGISTDKDITLAAGGTGEVLHGNGTWGDPFDITNADRPLTLNGNIGGLGNFVKNGRAAIVLSGNNTYSGTTTVVAGPLRLNSALALPGGIGATGGTSALTINSSNSAGAVIELTSASGDFLRGLGTGVDQFQIPGGISGFDSNSGARNVIVGNNAAFELQWGSTYFNPSALLLGYHSAVSGGTLTLQNKIDLNAATRTIAVNASTATISGDIRTSSGTAGLTKSGAGTLMLSGANTYNGPTTISAGTLTLSSASTYTNTSQIVLTGTSTLNVNTINANLARLVTGGGVPFGTFLRYSQAQAAAGGASNGPGTIQGTVELNLTNVNPDYTLDFGGIATLKNVVAATYNSPITISGNPSIDSSTASSAFTGGTSMTIGSSTAGAKTLTLTGTQASTLGGAIGDGSGTVAVTKTGTGSWALTGANTYSGGTTVSAGTLTLSGASGAIGSSAVTIAGGTLTVTNTAAANNTDRLSGSAFTMNGGTFNFDNDASNTSFSESAGTLTLVGGANTVAIQQAGASGSSTLTFAGLSRTAGSINFSGAGLGTNVDSRSKITFTSAPTLTPDGIIGPWATVNGINYATLIGNDVVAYGGVITDVPRKNGASQVIPDSSTANVRIIEGSGTLANLTLAGATTTTINSLMQSISGGTNAATIDIASGKTLLVNWVNAVPAAGALTLGTAANTGMLMPATAGGNLLLVNGSANTMTVNSVITNNTSASSVTKDGSGTLTLAANNSTGYSGGTIINAGMVSVSADNNLGNAGGGITFNGTSTLTNTAAVTSSRTITLNNGAIATLCGNFGHAFSGKVTGSGGLTLLNTGTTTLGHTGSDYQGPLWIQNGTAAVAGLTDGVGYGNIRLGSATSAGAFQWSASAVGALSLASRRIELAGTTGGGTLDSSSSAANTITVSSDLLISGVGNKTLTLQGSNGGVNTFAGKITDGIGSLISLAKSGTSIWALSGANSYSGVTTLNADGGQLTILGKPALSPYSTVLMQRSTTLSLRMDDAGIVNLGNLLQLSASDNSSGITTSYTIDVRNNGGVTTGSTLVLGKLDFAGNPNNNASSRKILSTGANGYRLQFGDVDLSYLIAGGATGGPQRFEPQSAAITIAGTIKQVSGNNGGSTTDNNLYLGGITGGNLVSGAIKDADDYPSNPNATPLNVYKDGTIDWTLTGVNTYSGSTTINQGVLEIGGAGVLGGGTYSANIVNNATFRYNSTTNQTLSGNISGTGLLVKNNTGTLTLAPSVANTYTGTTTVVAGTLLPTAAAALPNYTVSNRISVASGATLAARAGGVGEWAPSEIDSLLGATTAAFASGSKFGIDVTTGNTFTYANNIGITQVDKEFVKSGAGTLALTGVNTYTGATTVVGGTLQLGNGAGTGALSTNSPITVAAGAVFAVNQADTVTQGTDFSGAAITGPGGFAQVGSGTNLLNAANTYGGGTTVSAGTLLVNNLSGSGTGTGLVSVTGGTLGGTGTIGSNVTVAAAGSVAPGASVGTLSIGGNLDVVAMATGTGKLNFELGATNASDKIAVTNLLVIGSGVFGFSDFAFTTNVGYEVGTYKLITTTGGVNGSLASGDLFGVLPNISGAGVKGTLQITGNDLEMVVAYNTSPPGMNTPTAPFATIDRTNAILGATIGSDGGAAITNRGTSWSTNYISGQGDNVLSEGGTGTPPVTFSHARSGLSAGGHYYAWGWADNSVGRGYTTAYKEFYTEPDQAESPVISGVQGTQMTLTWTTNATMGGTIVLVKQGSAVDADPVDGTVYNASSVFGYGDPIGAGNRVVYTNSGNSVTITGLTPLQTYYVKVYAYAGSGAGLINYQQDAPPDASAPTPARSLVWDTNLGTSGGQDGGGTWLSENQWWEPALSANTTWLNDNATIGSGGGGNVISLGAVTAGSVTFGSFSGTYTLSGGSLAVSGGINVGSPVGSVTISTPVSGSGGIIKSGSGTLTLSMNNSALNGGITIGGGTVSVGADNNLGAAGTPIAFTGNAQLSLTATTDFGARPLSTTNSALVTVNLPMNVSFSLSGAVTGDGGLLCSAANGIQNCNLLSLNNTFTGQITVNNSGTTTLTMSSLADSTNAITLAGGVTFKYGSGAVADLTLNNRPIVLNGSAAIDNSSAYTLRLNKSISVSGTGSKTLTLQGSGGGTMAADVDQGSSTLSLTIGGTWYLSGINTYSGQTTVNGLVTFQGKQALAPNTLIYVPDSRSFTVLDDGTGTISLGNAIQFTDGQTGYGAGVSLSITVGNNSTANGGNNPSSTTTGSSMAFGTLTINPAPTRNTTTYRIQTYSSNGYRVQFGNVNLGLGANSGSAFGESFEPQTAPITITGIMQQPNGKGAGDNLSAQILRLDGITTDNLISGPIKNAADYDDSSNPNAKPLNVAKSSTSTWTLSGSNTYSGTTTVTGGGLIINGSTAAGSAVSVSGGTLGGTGTVGGAVTLSGTGSIELRDDAVGTLTVGSTLAITGAAGNNNLYFDLGAGVAGPDKIAVAGAVTMTTPNAGVVTLNPLGTANLGTYDLITGSSVPAFGNFTLATGSGFGRTYSLTNTATKLQLVVGPGDPGPAAPSWYGGGNNWSTGSNWTGGAVPGYQSNVSFYNRTDNITTDVLDTDFDINSLTFVAGATSSVTIGGIKLLAIEAGTANGNTAGNGITVNTPSSGTPTHTISARVGIVTSQVWTVNSGAALTVSGVVSDFGAGNSLTKAGAGTLTLSGLNTYSGPTIISNGTLVVSHQSIGNVTVPNVLGMSSANPANLVLNPGTTLRLDITGDAAKSTDRGFTINGTSPGDSATLDTSSAGNKGVDFTSAACPGYGVANQARTLVLSGTHTTSGGNYPNNVCTLEANIADNGSGAVSVIKNGAGYWRLLGNNTFTGGLSIQRGILLLGTRATAAGAGVVTIGSAGNSATLDLVGGSRTIVGLATAGTAANQTITSSAAGGVLNYTGATASTFGGVIAGGANTAVTVNNVGADLTLSGANTYTGATTVIAGILRVNGSTDAGSAVGVTGGALGGTGIVGGAVTLSGTGGIDLQDGVVGTLTISNNLAINGGVGANNLYFDLGNTAGGTDKIAVNGNVTMTTSGAAVINLNQLGGAKIDPGTNDLIVATGTMESVDKFTLATTSAFGNDFSLQVDGTSKKLQLVVTLAPVAPAVAFWKGAGANNNWSTIANWATNLTGDAASGAPGYSTDVNFYSTGAGRLTTGILDADFDINSLTYATGVISNTAVGGTKALTIEAGNGITVNTPASGAPTNTISANVGIATSQTWTVDSGAILSVSGRIGDLGGGNSLTKAGAGMLALSGSNTYSGATVISNGTVVITSVANGGTASPLGQSGSAAANLRLGNGVTLRYNSGSSVKSTDRGFTIDGTAPGDSATLESAAVDSGSLRGVYFTGTPCPGYGTANQTRTLILGGTFAASGADGAYYNRLSANIADNGSGAVSVVKTGSGSWSLVGNNTFTGGLSIQNGTLKLDSGTGTGAGLVTIGSAGNSATLDLNGGLRIVIALATAGTAANQTITSTAPGATLYYAGATTSTFGGLITGSSASYTAVIVDNAGASLTLTGANSFGGQLTVRSGTLSVPTVNNASANGPLGNSALAVILGDAGGKTGTLRYTGGTTSSSKAFTLATGGTGAFQVDDAAAVLTLGGAIGGAGNMTKAGAGTLELTASNTCSGATIVSGGTLLVNGSLATNAVAVTNGATLGGTGTVNGAVVVWANSTNAPGAAAGVSLGTFTAATNVTFQSGSTLAIDIDDTFVPGCDRLAVGGALDVSGATLKVNVGSLTANDVYIVATYPAGRLTGTFAGVSGLPADWVLAYNYNAQNAIALVVPRGTVFKFR